MDTAADCLDPVRLDQFVKLFRGRGDVYGAWEGGCVKQTLTPDKFKEHLMGTYPIGVYPLMPYKASWYCVWGCSDIDVDDLDAARNLQTALAWKDIPSWVERTRKGYHVWVFSESLVTGATMRRALLAAHQAINYPAKEVNPKQENPGHGYGNYVRLPYPGVVRGLPENRYVLDDNDQPMQFTDFISKAFNNRATHDKLEEIAQLWRPPTRQHVVMEEATADVRTILRKVGPLPYVIWRDGPHELADRSTTLMKLAYRMQESETVTPPEALVVLRSADQRWGKFYMRPNGEEELIKMIEKAYNIVWGNDAAL